MPNIITVKTHQGSKKVQISGQNPTEEEIEKIKQAFPKLPEPEKNLATESVAAPREAPAELGASDTQQPIEEPVKNADEVEQPGIFRQIRHGWEVGRTVEESAGILLEAAMPIGELIVDENGIRYDSPEELYGPEFSTMSYDQRREFLGKKREEEKRGLFEATYNNFQTEFPDIYEAGVEDSGWSTLGKVGSAIASPTSLIPIGQTYKAIAATSAVLGGGYSALDQEVKKGNIDLKEVAVTSAVSSVAGPLLVAATRFVGDKANTAITNYALKKQNKKNWTKLCVKYNRKKISYP